MGNEGIAAKHLSNVLVVDDNEDIIQVIKSALEDQPVNVFSANNGQDALSLLLQVSFDLLLLDVKMPDISGFEICRTVKDNEIYRSAKVIIVSASNLSDDKLRAFDVGADDYISKPFRIKELQARIKVMLNLRSAERSLTERNDLLLELIRVSEVMNSRTGQQNALYEEIIKSAVRLAKADCGCLLLWDEDAKQYLSSAKVNLKPDAHENTTVSFEKIAKEVYRLGQLVLLENTYKQGIQLLKPPFVFETAGIPLRLGQRFLGTIVVSMSEAGHHFAGADLEILGTLANLAAVALDNSRLYNTLAQSEGRYRLLAENASDLIITLDRHNILTYVNERVRTLLGFRPEEMLGKNFDNFLTLEGQLALNKITEILTGLGPLNSDSNQPVEIEARNKEGELVNLEFNWGLLYENNEITGLQAIGRDVTTRKRETEQERMRALGQMASGVAHDFNNVLANVLGHAQLLEADTEDPETLQTLRIIEQSALDGAETVRRIQEFTGHHMQQNLDLIDLNAVVQSTIELSRPRWKDDAQAKGLKIEIERDFQLLPPIRGKAAELREVLINMVNNALDAMPEGGGKIGFKTYIEKDMVALDVWDSGKGMPLDVRRHVFEPFYTTKGVRGTGLGLSIAYGIVSRSGGQISCESAVGKGTMFHIRLPAAYDEEFPAREKKRRVSRSGKSRKYQGRILAIDDEPNIRNVLGRALTMAGFEVKTAGSGREAVFLLEQSSFQRQPPFDMVFSDLGMPEMSGWDVANALYRRWPEIPLVLVTGWGDQLDQEKMVEAHIAHTVAKPFNISEVVSLAAQLIPQAE